MKQISETGITRNLEEILDSCMKKYLGVLWRRTGNPTVWLVRAFVILVFL
jgi:hypothetical protein